MTWLTRPSEPNILKQVRKKELSKLRALTAYGADPKSDDIDGYDIVKERLWRIQYLKCCYCEQKMVPDYNDVEHYRPKAKAVRLPGCSLTHGYWWLAFSWSNLLFSCAGCNRSAKRTLFPLEIGSISAIAENRIFRTEKPLLIDPYKTNPVEHIEYQDIRGYWQPRPRNGSSLGAHTIRTCHLDRSALKERRTDYFKRHLSPPIKSLQAALVASDLISTSKYYDEVSELFSRESEFSGMAYDAAVTLVNSAVLHRAIGRGWPSPSDVYI
jgi:uncharacterized protein (TIGR02646 family)